MTCESRALLSLSDKETLNDKSNKDGDDGTSTSTNTEERRHNGPSQYQLQRQANIAENQRLLASLGLIEGASNLIDKPSKKGKGKKKEKRYVFNLFVQVIWSNISSDLQ